MEEIIKEGKWLFDYKDWYNVCDKCCDDCEDKCDEYCDKVFVSGHMCAGCKYDDWK